MAHIQHKYSKLWRPQDIGMDKIGSQKMFIDNIDFLEEFALSVLKRNASPVATIDALRAINTSDESLYVDGTTVMVKSNGMYFFDRSNTSADNGTTIIKPNSGTGRWISDLTFIPAGIAAHLSSKDNPHSVTKAQVGLSNVDNTSDANKPISTAVANELKKYAKYDSDGELSSTGYSRLTGFKLLDSVDLNTITYPGQFGVNNKCTNRPFESGAYGFLEVIAYSSTWLIQRYYKVDGNGAIDGIYYRTQHSTNKWTTWTHYTMGETANEFVTAVAIDWEV